MNDEQSTVETKNLTVTGSDGSLNAADILKQIKVPYEYRNKPAQAAKYQMEQLRLKVSFISYFYDLASGSTPLSSLLIIE